MSQEKFLGLFRGTVLQNIDPKQQGRLQLEVPDVSLLPTTWAEPCVPLAGAAGPMGVYMVPPVGAGVWVEFEHGDPNWPVWVGCRWGLPSDVPTMALLGNPADPSIVIQSFLQHMIMISDMPPAPPPAPSGGITLKSTTGAMIVVNDAGIFISNGKGAEITLIGPTIDFNKGALTILQ